MEADASPLFALDAMTSSFIRSLRAENVTERTLTIYAGSLATFGAFLTEHQAPTDVRQITRRHVEAFVVDQLARLKPNTAASRFRNLRRFFRWLEAEGEIEGSPMAGMTEPAVPEVPVDVVSEKQVQALLKVCQGREFVQSRDFALILMLYDTGLRASELIGLMVDDLDLDDRRADVMGKGRRPRAVGLGKKLTGVLDKYLRLRAKHPHAELPNLWLGKFGALTLSGLEQIVSRRGKQAGVEGLHPHRFRHAFNSAWLANGGQEQDLVKLAGWKSRDMLARYGAATATQRALEAHRRLSPGDRL